MFVVSGAQGDADLSSVIGRISLHGIALMLANAGDTIASWPEELRASVIDLARLETADLAQANAAAARIGRFAAPDDKAEVLRIGYVVSRTARLVPWRSDCLVQALAAQRWLLRGGIATEIVIGIDQTQKEGFLSHAWLRWGELVVTGGSVTRYSVILGPDDLSPGTRGGNKG